MILLCIECHRGLVHW